MIESKGAYDQVQFKPFLGVSYIALTLLGLGIRTLQLDKELFCLILLRICMHF